MNCHTIIVFYLNYLLICIVFFIIATYTLIIFNYSTAYTIMLLIINLYTNTLINTILNTYRYTLNINYL